MRRLSSLLVLLVGVWTAGAPWFGPVFGLGTMSGSSGMAGSGMMHDMAGPAVVLTAQTLWYHVLPGALAIILGLYQLLTPAGEVRRGARVEPRSAAARP